MLLNNVLAGILSIKYYIVGSVLAALAMSVLILTIGSRRKKGLAVYGWQALFFNLSLMDCMLLTALISQMIFVVTGALGNTRITPVTGGAFAVLAAAACALERKAAGLVEQAVFTVMALAAMTAGNLLRDFMADTGFSLYMMAVYVLLLIFEIQYALYHLVKGLERMTADHEG
ncbi:hypothetical protein ACTNCH_09875 [Candidatus Merdisoma sp. HCP28S3_D10]|uniref:hypothetical protein n=1 Tax=unclassified Candidatus Merdisoma TaxID=3099611 RepID=UPI003F8AA27F